MNWRIGVPILPGENDKILMWILGMLKKLRNDFNDDHIIQQMIDDILRDYSNGDKNYIKDLKIPEHIPPIFLTGVNLPYNEIENND